MKKVLVLLLAGAIAASLAVSANAADIKALKGTPKVDGVIDEIYKQSGTLTTKAGEQKIWSQGTGADDSDESSTTYVLWDEDYIYIATEVTESTIVNTEKAPDNWMADAVEHWITYNDVKDKVSVDAFGNGIYGNGASVPHDDCVWVAKTGKDSYVVELAIPTDAYKAGDTMGFSIQINDFLDKDTTNGAAWGSQQAEHTITLSADEVVLPKEPEKTVETADPTILAALAAAAAAGVAFAKRKH